MKYLSVCSGIEAASVAWSPLGWQAVAFSEIDAFPCAVLAHHYPDVPNRGDLTRFQEWPDAVVDVLVGGTPCQSFSVAGLRKGLDDPRGSLMLTYLAVARRYRPRWVVWENVPGVLSSNGGRDFAAFRTGLAELGYLGCHRVLDAQYFGLAQRRKRVFVVGHLGDWRRAAAVLFERASLSGHPAPRRETGQVAPTVPARRTAGGGYGTDFDCDGGIISIQGAGQRSTGPHMNGCGVSAPDAPMYTLNAAEHHAIAHSLTGEGFDAGEDGTGRGTPFDARQSDVLEYGDQSGPLDTDGHSVAIAFSVKDHGADAGDLAPTLRAGGHTSSHANGGVMPAVAFAENQRGELTVNDTAGSLKVGGGKPGQGYPAVAHFQDSQFGCQEYDTAAIRAGRIPEHSMVLRPHMAVRRLTPRECERLQGFPDDYTRIPYRGKFAADGPRYKALGNSMAVPVMRWIGQRIAAVEAL